MNKEVYVVQHVSFVRLKKKMTRMGNGYDADRWVLALNKIYLGSGPALIRFFRRSLRNGVVLEG